MRLADRLFRVTKIAFQDNCDAFTAQRTRNRQRSPIPKAHAQPGEKFLYFIGNRDHSGVIHNVMHT